MTDEHILALMMSAMGGDARIECVRGVFRLIINDKDVGVLTDRQASLMQPIFDEAEPLAGVTGRREE